MADSRDVVDIDGLRPPRAHERIEAAGPRRAFLSVWYRCCHVYGRMQRNAESTRYEGRCPKCGAAVHARIGPQGTTRRSFEAR